MNLNPPPKQLDLVLVGGGHAHVHILKMLGMPINRRFCREYGIQTTLIAKDLHTPYSGMLPGFVAGHYTYDDIHLDVATLCRFSNIRLIHASACRITYNNKNNATNATNDSSTQDKDATQSMTRTCLLESDDAENENDNYSDNDDPPTATPNSRSRSSRGGMIYCSDGRPPIRFDALSIDIGITPSTNGIVFRDSNHCTTREDNHNDTFTTTSTATTTNNNNNNVIPVKPIANFCQYYQTLQQTILDKYQNTFHQNSITTTADNHKHVIAVIGGGAGGIELALSMEYAFRQQTLSSSASASPVQIMVVTRGKSLLESHNAMVQRIFHRILQEREIPVYCDTEVVGVEAIHQQIQTDTDTDNKSRHRKRLILSQNSPARVIDVDDVLWCTQASAAQWLSDATPFDTTAHGNFIKVDSTYESTSHKGVFACGDCCHMVNHPRPKAGVFAVRAGPPLLENLKRYLSNQPLQKHIPQRDFLGLISTGNKYAVASKGWWFALEGQFLWTVKDYIDRTWMDQYTAAKLPNLEEMMAEMNFSTLPNKRRKILQQSPLKSRQVTETFFAADPMRCGGCGAKVGTTTVSRVLSAVHKRQVRRSKALQQPAPPPIDHDDAAILPLPLHRQGEGHGGGAIVQTIDYFRSLVDDPFTFGKIVAVHALGDIHAMGAKAQSALALAVVPFSADERITESLLVHLLSGISDVLQEENVQLVGGHTCEGIELACGLSVQGYTDDPNKLLRKRGGRVGDKIILTKPLGTGALFAADMRAKNRGEYVAQAMECMMQSNLHASTMAMATPGVRACTDCTGFGLMGHLLEMLIANEAVDKTSHKLDSIGAVLNIHNMNFLKGGLHASSIGIFSSLQLQNQHSRRAVRNHAEAAKAFPTEYPLLFDPQTAGGLIFFVDPSASDSFLSILKETYPAASEIGELVRYPENEEAAFKEGGVCPIGSGGVLTGQRVRILL